jgi:hypothetical protein
MLEQTITGPDTTTAPAITPGPPAPAPSGSDQGAQDPYVRVPKESLSAWNGDWHALAAHANRFKDVSPYADSLDAARKAGMTPEQFAEMIGYYVKPSDPAAPLDLEAIRKESSSVAEKTAQSEVEKWEKKLEAKTRAQQIEAGVKMENDFISNTLEKWGYPEQKDGKPNRIGKAARYEFTLSLEDILRRDMPQNLTKEQMEMYWYRPSQKQLEEAAQHAAGELKSRRYEQAAQVAREQSAIPSATLGSGPGGKQPPPDWNKMTEKERVELVTRNLNLQPD